MKSFPKPAELHSHARFPTDSRAILGSVILRDKNELNGFVDKELYASWHGSVNFDAIA